MKNMKQLIKQKKKFSLLSFLKIDFCFDDSTLKVWKESYSNELKNIVFLIVFLNLRTVCLNNKVFFIFLNKFQIKELEKF